MTSELEGQPWFLSVSLAGVHSKMGCVYLTSDNYLIYQIPKVCFLLIFRNLFSKAADCMKVLVINVLTR